MLKSRYKYDTLIEAGLDEAGRGCLWGPFYAAAVVWKNEESWTDEIRKLSEQIKDSKKISGKKRDKIYEGILKHAEGYGVGIVTLPTQPQRILIDGCLAIESSLEQVVEPQLDNTYICVAAASILAKVSRDRAIIEMVNTNAELNNKYDLANNKGYGTLKHRNGITQHGKHELHRNLFLRKLLGTKSSNTNDTTCAFLEET